MRKIKDRVILGMLAGLIGDIPKLLASEVLYRRQIQKGTFSKTVGGVFLPRRKANTKRGRYFGLFAETAISSTLGVPMVYLFSLTGKDYALVKGGGAGMIAFEALRGLASNIGPGKTYPRDVTTNFYMSATSLLWGVATAWAITALGDESVFKQEPIRTIGVNETEQEPAYIQ